MAWLIRWNAPIECWNRVCCAAGYTTDASPSCLILVSRCMSLCCTICRMGPRGILINPNTGSFIILLSFILIFFQSVFPTINSLIGIDFEMSLPIGSYVVYMLLGYYISCTDIEKSNKGVLIICFIAIISMIIRYWLLYNSDEKIPYLFTYFGLFAIFPAIAVFMLVKRLVCNSAELHSFWTFLSSKSLGVYLIHTFLIVIFAKVMSRENPWFILLATILIYFLSAVIVLIIQKNSFCKRNLLP